MKRPTPVYEYVTETPRQRAIRQTSLAVASTLTLLVVLLYVFGG